MPRTDLRDKVVLLTGAGGGIGRACALEFARHGANLVLADVDRAALSETGERLTGLGCDAILLPADLSTLAGVDELADAAFAEAGRVDVLFNNAGIMLATLTRNMQWADYERLAAINLWAPIRLAHRCLPAMLERGSGHLAATASMDGLATAPGTAAYGVTKAGLIAWHEALRAELRGSGVRCTVICPGMVRTDLFEHGDIRDERFLARTRQAPRIISLSPERVARRSVRAIERGQPVVYLGWERATVWLKLISIRAFDAYNALLGRVTFEHR